MLHNAPLSHSAELNKKCKATRDLVAQESAFNPETTFRLLLYTAQFELKLKEVWLKIFFQTYNSL